MENDGNKRQPARHSHHHIAPSPLALRLPDLSSVTGPVTCFVHCRRGRCYSCRDSVVRKSEEI